MFSGTTKYSSKELKGKANIHIDKFFQGNQYLDTFYIPLTSNISIVLKRANTWKNSLLPGDCSVIPKISGHYNYFSTSLGILWDGRVTVCCQDFDAQLIIGDVTKNSIMEVIKSKKISKMRSMEKKGILVDKHCQICKGKIQRNGQNFRMIKPQPLINRIYELINRINVRLKID